MTDRDWSKDQEAERLRDGRLACPACGAAPCFAKKGYPKFDCECGVTVVPPREEN